MDVEERFPIWPAPAPRQESPTERFYKDILDGLTVFYQSPLIHDIRQTALAYPDSKLGGALNKKQTASKIWVLDEILNAVGPDIGTVHVHAGWYGVLGALLLNDPRFNVGRLINFDIDPSCAAVAMSLNATAATADRFEFREADILELSYPLPGGAAPDVIINTSCEHLDRFGDWLNHMPSNTWLVLQSNDYEGIEGHVNCSESLEAFSEQARLRELAFTGQLTNDKYTRFMLIGRK